MANKTGNGMEVVYTQLVYNRFRNFRVPERSKKKQKISFYHVGEKLEKKETNV